MEPKISRSKAKTVSTLLWIAVVLCLIGVITAVRAGGVYLMLISLVFTFYIAYRLDQVCKCPHCGTHFRGLDPSKPNAGYCRKCGKLMEFDEESEG